MSRLAKVGVIGVLVTLCVVFATMSVVTQSRIYLALFMVALVTTCVTCTVLALSNNSAKKRVNFRQGWLPVIVGFSFAVLLPAAAVFCLIGAIDNFVKGQVFFGVLWVLGVVTAVVGMIKLTPHFNRLMPR